MSYTQCEQTHTDEHVALKYFMTFRTKIARKIIGYLTNKFHKVKECKSKEAKNDIWNSKTTTMDAQEQQQIE